MPQAVVDPDEVRQFAQNLKRFNRDVGERIRVIQSQLQALGNSWRDQEHRKFAEEFQAHAQNLVRFIEANELHVRYLNRKIAHIDDYLQS